MRTRTTVSDTHNPHPAPQTMAAKSPGPSRAGSNAMRTRPAATLMETDSTPAVRTSAASSAAGEAT
ncbi:MAG TPA: hypothetical protein VGX97_03245 [bacterium]|nr:hypothetical protein [bacterium]